MTGTRVVRGPAGREHKFLTMPGSALGWWAGVLAIAFVVSAVILLGPGMRALGVEGPLMGLMRMVVPVVGVVSVIVAVMALTQEHERSWFTWLGLLPGVAFLLAALAEIVSML